jgi:RNA-directed DNA polymerase
MEILSRLIKDNRVLSLIQKFLNAGIMDRGMFIRSDVGVPQGGLCRARHNPPYVEINIMPS